MRISDWSSDVCSSDLVGFRSEGILVAARRRLAAFVLLAACLRISWLFALVFVARHDLHAGRPIIRIVLPPVPVGGIALRRRILLRLRFRFRLPFPAAHASGPPSFLPPRPRGHIPRLT